MSGPGTLLLVCLVPFLQSGGELSFPTGPAAPGTVAVRVVDRNRIPLAHAVVRGVFEAADASCYASRHLGGGSEHAGLVPLGPEVTGRDGRVDLEAPAGGWCGITVERSGFAPGSFLPLFAG